jgi:hypothetical protein
MIEVEYVFEAQRLSVFKDGQAMRFRENEIIVFLGELAQVIDRIAAENPEGLNP